MRESLYGWYPSAESIYKRKSEYPSNYDKECAYKHYRSTYNRAGGSIRTPEPPQSIRIQLAQRPGTGKHGSNVSSRSYSRASSRIPTTQSYGQAQLNVAPTVERCPPPQVEVMSPAPVSYTSSPAGRPESSVSNTSSKKSQQSKHWAMKTDPTPVTSPTSMPYHSSTPPCSQKSVRKPRVQSATITRPTPPASPQRRIKSAGPVRSQPSDNSSCQIKTPSHNVHPGTAAYSCTRPEAPVPPSRDNWIQQEEVEVEEEPMDYDEQLKRHGWRMQVHGDPLGLKKPCIPKRRAFAVSIADSNPAPPPPKAHMMNYETYFYNTIPKKPRTFTIHQEWVSEVLHAKRMELQARDGPKYSYAQKNFSFLY